MRWRLLVVTLLALTSVGCHRHDLKQREWILRDDLFTLRQDIEQYTFDKQKAPSSLDDIIRASYLKQLPVDPMTESRTTWRTVQCSELMSVDQTEAGICDVHSGAGGMGTDGTPYNTW